MFSIINDNFSSTLKRNIYFQVKCRMLNTFSRSNFQTTMTSWREFSEEKNIYIIVQPINPSLQ